MLVIVEVLQGVIVIPYTTGGSLSVRLTLRKLRLELRALSVLALLQERVCVSVTHVLDALCAPAVLLCNHER